MNCLRRLCSMKWRCLNVTVRWRVAGCVRLAVDISRLRAVGLDLSVLKTPMAPLSILMLERTLLSTAHLTVLVATASAMALLLRTLLLVCRCLLVTSAVSGRAREATTKYHVTLYNET